MGLEPLPQELLCTVEISSRVEFQCGDFFKISVDNTGSFYKRQKPQAPTPQAPIRNRQTRKVANAKGLNRNTNLN